VADERRRRLNTVSLGSLSPWVVSRVDDYNGDGLADILWANASTGAVAMWLMSGGTVLMTVDFGNQPPWIPQ
jgi:hypothetical protein